MIKLELKEFKKALDSNLESRSISGKVILDRFCVIDESSRRSASYVDPNYSGFYYHLSKYVSPCSLLEIGFDLGLLSGTFLSSCKTVKKFLGYRQINKEFTSTRLGERNIKRSIKGDRNFYMGNLYDFNFEQLISGEWDMVFITDESHYDKHLEYLDFIWPSVSENGIIVCEYLNKNKPAKDAFMAFCESKNRQPLLFATRYGTGLVQK